MENFFSQESGKTVSSPSEEEIISFPDVSNASNSVLIEQKKQFEVRDGNTQIPDDSELCNSACTEYKISLADMHLTVHSAEEDILLNKWALLFEKWKDSKEIKIAFTKLIAESMTLENNDLAKLKSIDEQYSEARPKAQKQFWESNQRQVMKAAMKRKFDAPCNASLRRDLLDTIGTGTINTRDKITGERLQELREELKS